MLDGVEIHFMHYTSEADAKEKWERRAARVNMNHLIFTFTDRDLCTPELIQQFKRIPGRKLLLTARPMPWIPCAVTVPAYRGLSEIGDAYTHFENLTHINYRGLVDGMTQTQSARTVTDLTTESTLVRPLGS